MTLQKLKVLEENNACRRPWGFKLIEFGLKDPTIQKGFLVDGFASYFKVSKMPELEKLAFVEKWASEDEAGRYLMEKAFLCDYEAKS